jgi:two-component system chemotaxis response regulator CheY
MKNCLVVDDSAVIRKIVRQLMENLGFACVEADNGKVAYESCQQAMPQVVMLDWNMPVMNGLDFLKSLRALPGGEVPTVIFCTTENDMSHIQLALECGANDFIMKPFDKEIVRSKLIQNSLIEE